MRLALCIALLLISPSAFAGAAVAGFIAWVAANAVLVQIALTVALGVYGSSAQRRSARHKAEDARRDYNASLQDRTITSVSAEDPFRRIYGQARVGSTVTSIFASGDKDQYKYLVCIHAAHECEEIGEIYLAGKPLGALDGAGNVTGGAYATIVTGSASQGTGFFTPESHSAAAPFNLNHTPVAGTLTLTYVTTDGNAPYNQTRTTHFVDYTIAGATVTPIGPYVGQVLCTYQYRDVIPRVTVEKHLGTPGQAASPMLRAAIPTLWPATATLDGFCYTVIKLDLNQPEFQGGLIQVEPIIKGAKVYDPRTALTVWSDNPALCTRDYLLCEFCNQDPTDIPDASYITAANVCDEVIGVGKRYTLNGSVLATDDPKQVLQAFADSMAGTIVNTTWEIMAGKYVAPVQSLSQSDIVGNLTVNPGTSNADKFNGIRGQYVSAETAWVATDFKPFSNATYVAVDGDEIYQNNNFPLTNSVQRVWNLCRIRTEDDRNGFTLKADFSRKVWAREIGDRVTFDSTFLGQVAKVYRITDREFPPNGVITLTLKEDAASIWDEADATTPDDTPNTNFPNPFVIDAPASLTAESGTDALLIQDDGTIISRIHVTWPTTTSQAVFTNGVIDIEWWDSEIGIIHREQVSGAASDAYLAPVEDGRVYEVRARARNPYLNTISDWTYADNHTVIGKTEPPASVLTLSIQGRKLSWTEVTDKDLAGYIFRFHYGTNTDWGSAAALHTGYITESPWEPEVLPYGAVTIMVKAIDTTKNESLITANIFTDLGDPILRNEIDAYDFDPLYPGTYTNCFLLGGDLVASAVDSFYGAGSASFYSAGGGDSFYDAPATGYFDMEYISSDVSLSMVLPGSKLTLEITTQGDGVIIEYRSSMLGEFYGTSDTDPFYGTSDADPFYDGDVGDWLPWPGQVDAIIDSLQFRVRISGGLVQGKIFTMRLVMDAPDIVEEVPDLAVSSSGTTIPYTKTFTRILSVQATLQANLSGGETVEIDKTFPLAPSSKVYNNVHVPVDGATVDYTLRGY